jgi:hypothetical protein
VTTRAAAVARAYELGLAETAGSAAAKLGVAPDDRAGEAS